MKSVYIETSSMHQNEIIAEVWKNREAFAKRHQHNFHKIVMDIQKRRKTPLSRLVDRKRRTTGPMVCRETRLA